MKKRILSLFLSLAVILTIIPLSLQASALSYNAKDAVNYVSNHWNDGVGLCATFVSNCLKAGGCTVSSSTVTSLNSLLVNSGYCTRYLLQKSGTYYVYESNNSGKLAAGDPVLFYCNTCGGWQHAAICSGFDSDGRAMLYGHNPAWQNRVSAIGGYIDAAGHTGSAISVYSYRMIGVGSHTHQKGEFAFYWAAHPHYNSYYCSLCGEVYTEMSETNLLNNCDDCYGLGKSVVKTDKQTYLLGEKVKITWSAVDKATHYNLWVLKKTANGDYVTVSRNDSLTGNSITISGLDIGEYQICHYTYNSNMWEKDNSDWRHTGSDYVYIKVEANAGWQHNSRGWWYRNSDGSYPASCWQWIDNAWYYFDASGYIVTGWQWIGNSWYYFNTSGVMATGWQYIDGAWYYLNGSGLISTGWQWIDNAWYYFNASGVMATGWQFVDGAWYYLNGSGLISTGWQWIGNAWYYFNASGIMTTGWQWIDGAWYFLYSSGAMASNCYIDGYYITPSGAMA